MKSPLLLVALLLAAPAAFACETVTVGDLTIQHAWSKATIGASRPAVFYVEIANGGSTGDALVGIDHHRGLAGGVEVDELVALLPRVFAHQLMRDSLFRKDQSDLPRKRAQRELKQFPHESSGSFSAAKAKV